MSDQRQEGPDKVSHVQGQVDELKGIMVKNIGERANIRTSSKPCIFIHSISLKTTGTPHIRPTLFHWKCCLSREWASHQHFHIWNEHWQWYLFIECYQDSIWFECSLHVWKVGKGSLSQVRPKTLKWVVLASTVTYSTPMDSTEAGQHCICILWNGGVSSCASVAWHCSVVTRWSKHTCYKGTAISSH